MWTFLLPTKVSFGAGVAKTAPEIAAAYGRRPVLVTDATLAALPHIQELMALFGDAPVFAEVHPNPTVGTASTPN